MKLIKSANSIPFIPANTPLTTVCLLRFKITLPSEVTQERKDKFVIKFAGCHNLLWRFGIDFLELRLFFYVFVVLLCYHLYGE